MSGPSDKPFDAAFVCNCKDIPRTNPQPHEHLYDCPVRVLEHLNDQERFKADCQEAAKLLSAGDVEGLVAFANRNIAERVDAAFLRSRAYGQGGDSKLSGESSNG